MSRFKSIVGIVALLAFWPLSLWADLADPGPHPVATLEENWRDEARSRTIPVKIYYPADGKDARPTILFSHGLGGNREAGKIWGEHWASYGYVSIHMQHPGSDSSVIHGIVSAMDDLRRAMMDPQSSIDRIMDVKFVLDTIEKLPPGHKLAGMIDMRRVGISGHSFGAFTALSRIGMVVPMAGKEGSNLVDPRLKASLPMSAPPKIGITPPETLFGSIKVPVMLMTGTEDDSPISSTKAADRPIPYRCMPPGNKYLLVFNGADHMIFNGGQLRRLAHPQDDTIKKMVKIFSLRFWDAYLMDNASAREWLQGNGATETLAQAGTLERK